MKARNMKGIAIIVLLSTLFSIIVLSAPVNLQSCRYTAVTVSTTLAPPDNDCLTSLTVWLSYDPLVFLLSLLRILLSLPLSLSLSRALNPSVHRRARTSCPERGGALVNRHRPPE